MVNLEFKRLVLRSGMPFDYRQQLIEIVRNIAPLDAAGVQKRGFSEGDMDEAEALATKIEAANGSVELTAAEVMGIAQKVQSVQWPYADKAFKQFMVDIKELTSQ